MTENQPSRNAIADLVRGTRKLTDEDLRNLANFSKRYTAIRVRLEFDDKWHWGASAEYLYRALIKALGLDENDEEELLRLAKPKPGRKEERELAGRIYSLKEQCKTVREIQQILAEERKHLSIEAIAAYLKTRRRQRTR